MKKNTKTVQNMKRGLDASLYSAPIKKDLDRLETLEETNAEIRVKYLKTALYPDSYQHRLPDSLTQPTNIYRSVREFSLNANMDPAGDSGRFSVAIQPILGAIDKPVHYEVGIVNNTNGWPTDFADPENYLTDSIAGDPRQDPNLNVLTSIGNGEYYAPVTQFNVAFPSTSTYYGSFFAPGDIKVNTLPINIVAGNTFNFTSQGNNFTFDSPYYYSVPTGTYRLDLTAINVAVWTVAVPSFNLGWIVLALDNSNNIVGTMTFRATAADFIDGVFVDHVHRLEDWHGSIYNFQQGLNFQETMNVCFSSQYKYTFGLICNLANQTSTQFMSGVSLLQTYDPILACSFDEGLITRLRPIGMSALFTCTLPDLQAGGNIVSYSAPQSDINQYFYQTVAGVGPYQHWEVLARNNKEKSTHDGNLKEGTYVWYQPWGTNDILMRRPSETLDYGYPGIIISGQVSPAAGLTGPNNNIGRLRIITVYEFVTDSTLFDPKPCFGSTEDFDFVVAYLAELQHAMENPNHVAKVADYLKRGIKFVGDSIPSMIKGLTLAGQIVPMLL